MVNIRVIQEKLKRSLGEEHTGHDYAHTMRVLKNAVTIAKTEPKADLEVVKAAALLHDFAYSKRFFSGEHGSVSAKLAEPILKRSGFSTEQRNKIIQSIRLHNPFVHPRGKFLLETNILRDADRLDALGHTGIMRGIAYAVSAKKDVIRVLEEQMDYRFQTKKGKELAVARQKIIKEFVKNLKKDLKINQT